jgi:hypothetical protein
LGYALDRVLFYGTAGGALGDVATGQSGFLQHNTKGGWTAGAGVEVAFGENLSARIEYLYLKLQNSVCTSPNACGSDMGGPPNDTVKFSTNMIRLGQVPLTERSSLFGSSAWLLGVAAIFRQLLFFCTIPGPAEALYWGFQ